MSSTHENGAYDKPAQWQTSLNEQIVEMHRLAVAAGLYDAADWLKQSVRAEMREAMGNADYDKAGCEVCGSFATVRAWGWDGSLLCAEHYRIADERRIALEREAHDAS
jgi:hypothetical protein